MNKSDFYFELPPELIAQSPLERRDASRLLCLDRLTGKINHRLFSDLPDILEPGDLLVLNDSRVIPARLLGTKVQSGAAIEFLLLKQESANTWEILVKPGRRALPGAIFSFGGGILTGEILEIVGGGNRLARFSWQGDFYEALDEAGIMPLPHYITESLSDPDRYQTVYAKDRGSAAAPTAGLHFTPALFECLAENGIDTAFVTLHVGLGTFRPVKTENITEHQMHSESFVLPDEAEEKIRRAKAAGRRVIAVGTTSCRTLESMAEDDGSLRCGSGSTDIFIYPGYRFKVIDGLITNFHLPESTLIMLVSAFAGHESTMKAYREAINKKYRFFSFGDAIIIL